MRLKNDLIGDYMQNTMEGEEITVRRKSRNKTTLEEVRSQEF